MKTTLSLLAGVAVLAYSMGADAARIPHPRSVTGPASLGTLQIECHKTTDDQVVCRGLFSGGDVARGIPIQLIHEDSDKVLATAKTDVEGKYRFTAPGPVYSVVIQASKAEVASLSSEDIW